MTPIAWAVLGVLLGVGFLALTIFFAVLLLSIWQLRSAVLRLVSIVEPVAKEASLPSLARSVIALAENGPVIGTHIQSLVSSVDELQKVLFTPEPRATAAPVNEYRPTNTIPTDTVRTEIAAARVRAEQPQAPEKQRQVLYGPPDAIVVDGTDENSGFLSYDEQKAGSLEEAELLRRQGIETDDSRAPLPEANAAIVASV